MSKKKLRKPRDFGIANEIGALVFSVDKEDGVVSVVEVPKRDDLLDFEPKNIRWLANQLNKAADYLEQL